MPSHATSCCAGCARAWSSSSTCAPPANTRPDTSQVRCPCRSTSWRPASTSFPRPRGRRLLPGRLLRPGLRRRRPARRCRAPGPTTSRRDARVAPGRATSRGRRRMKVLMVVNGSAYGLDSTYNAIRLAGNLAKRDSVELTVFLMGDGVTAAMSGQKTPDGYYKLRPDARLRDPPRRPPPVLRHLHGRPRHHPGPARPRRSQVHDGRARRRHARRRQGPGLLMPHSQRGTDR